MSRARDKIKRQARLLKAMLDMMYAGHRGPVFDTVERAYNGWSAMARKAAKGKGKRFCVPG